MRINPQEWIDEYNRLVDLMYSTEADMNMYAYYRTRLGAVVETEQKFLVLQSNTSSSIV